jgi:hypothetical protein
MIFGSMVTFCFNGKLRMVDRLEGSNVGRKCAQPQSSQLDYVMPASKSKKAKTTELFQVKSVAFQAIFQVQGLLGEGSTRK